MKRACLVLAIAVAAVGAGVRVVDFAQRRSLWEDEIKLALNVGARGLGGLARPLDHEQLAPVPYLWALKGATATLGMNEAALRLPALVASLALLALMVGWAFRLLEPPAALAAVAFVALTPLLAHYANEVKPYEGDAAITVAVAWLLLARDGPRRAAAVGAVAATLSLAAPFILPAPVALAAARGRVRGWRAAALASIAWLTVFVALYLLVYRDVSQLPYMQQFWHGATLAGQPGHAYRITVGELWGFGALTPAAPELWIAGALLVAGAAGLALRLGLARAAVVVAPLLLVCAASLFGLYPIAGRTMTFAAPLVAVIVAEALWLIARPLARVRVRGVVVVAAAALLLVPGTRKTFERVRRPRGPEVREAVAWLRARIQPGDSLYLSARAVEPWLFYATDWSRPDREEIAWMTAVGAISGPAHENAPSRGHAVEAEGDDLVHDVAGVHILVGVASGCHVDMEPPEAAFPRRVDRGFLQNELRRLKQVQGRLLVLHYRDFENSHAPLVAGLGRGRRVERFSGENVSAAAVAR